MDEGPSGQEIQEAHDKLDVGVAYILIVQQFSFSR